MKKRLTLLQAATQAYDKSAHADLVRDLTSVDLAENDPVRSAILSSAPIVMMRDPNGRIRFVRLH